MGMQPRHQVSRTAIELITQFEGFRSKAARLADGRWTIGYGHTLTAREGAEIDAQDAEALLLYDLINVAHEVNEHTYTPLTQNQFDALCAFAFNIGVEPFRRSSVLRLINEGQLLQAACAMELWRKAWFEGELIVIDALVRRRAAEKTLFLTPTHGFIAAPSAILPPKIDVDGMGLVPLQTPAVIRADLEGEAAVASREGSRPDVAAFTPEPEDDSGPGPARAAAAALAAKLQTIFPETPAEVEPAADEIAEAEPDTSEIAAFPAAALAEPADEQPAAMAELEDALAAELAADLRPAGEDVLVDAAALDAVAPPAANLTGAALPDDSPAALDKDDADVFPEPAPAAAAAGGGNVRPFPLSPPEVFPEPANNHVDEQPFVAVLPERPEPRPARWRIGAPWLLLGALLGVALFAWGLFWVFNSQVVRGPAGTDPMVLGWLAGIAGVGFFGVAAYMLLDRLGRADDEIEGEGGEL